MDRDCKNCIYARTPDDPYNNGCTAWSCEFISRREAIKLIKSIVKCKDCKYYDTESRTFPCCTDIYGAVRQMDADDFCSRGEHKGE